MACSDVVIRVADDVNLESLPDGNPQIHYASPSTYGMTQGARALQVYLDILSIVSGTSVHLVFDWSQDGRTWHSSVFSLDNLLSSADYKSATGFYPFFYIGQPHVELAASYVRYGIIVYGTTGAPGTMGTVRLTCSVVALKSLAQLAHTWDLADTTTMDDTQTDARVGNILTTEGLSTLVVNGVLSGAPGAAITFDIQTSTRYDTDAMWKTVGSLSVSDGNVFTIEASQVLTFTRIVYTSTTASSVTLRMDVLGRS